MIYYIRAIESDWPLVESLAIALGVAQRNPETNEMVGQGWVFIGPVYKQEAPVRDDQGNLYIHANLVMEGSLRELAEARAASNRELATALRQIPRFFVTDENGQPVAPKNPARVIF